MEDVGQTNPADPAMPPPVFQDDQTVTEVQCLQCQTKAKWTGPLTDEMLERTFTRGLADDGLPNCPHCGTAMTVVPFLTAEEAITQAARDLDAERAGDAAKPMYQPSIPGIRPPFDLRRAQITTESLERNVATAEEAWEDAKKEASDRKKAFDETVDVLRKHIQATHTARMEAEYQAGRETASDGPTDTSTLMPCLFEQHTGQPCPICRTAGPVPVQRDAVVHVAAGTAVAALDRTLTVEGLAAAIEAVTGIVLTPAAVTPWTDEDRLLVARWLERFVQQAEPWADPAPLVIGHWHEAAEPSGEVQACRICGAVLKRFTETSTESELVPWPIGQKVGLDCPGESAAEPAHRPRRRATKKKS